MDKAKILRRTKVFLPITLVLIFLLLLCLRSAAALDSARAGLSLCARVIIPSLLPFFALSYLLSDLGLVKYFGRVAAPVMSKLFGVSGNGASAFIFGISGGYPLGASIIADLYTKEDIEKEEAERLLAFCNNSGPAFIIGATGVGIFRSAPAGFLLYFTHILSAVMVGILFSGRTGIDAPEAPAIFTVKTFPEAFAESVKKAAAATITICAFIIFFSVVTGVLESFGAVKTLVSAIANRLALDIKWVKALFTGILELGGGIASMDGLPLNPLNFALASFILGFGGLSVHSQTLSLLAGCELSSKWHFAGKLLQGALSAILGFIIFSIVGIWDM